MKSCGVEDRVAEQVVADLKSNYRMAKIDLADSCMLEYCVKLTLTPQSMVAADVERLKASGFDELAIHDICSIAAYFAFVNRIADGLGVELED